MSDLEYLEPDADDFFDNLPDLRGKDDKEAAHALFEHLKRVAVEDFGQSEREVFIAAPGERSEAGNNWWVCWEAGPPDWAIQYTLDGKKRTCADSWYCESYWGFDCIFQRD